MAKVLYPFNSPNVSGRLGDHVYQHSRYGQIVRTWYPPCQSRKPDQTHNRRQLFHQSCYQYSNQSSEIIERWIDFCQNFYTGHNPLSRKNLSPQQAFIARNIRTRLTQYADITNPPISPSCSYTPWLEITWTASGALLSWSPAIPVFSFILVSQKRNLTSANYKPTSTVLSHIFNSNDYSPQLLTPPAGNGGGPGDLPPFTEQSYLHFHVWAVDNHGNHTPSVFFNIRAG